MDDYYRNEDGLCIENPVLCSVFNTTTFQCSQCLTNADLKNGFCYDRNCEVFGPRGECYGCMSAYTFGPRGECQPRKIDSTCK